MDPLSLISQADKAIALARKIRGALKKVEHSEILIWVSDLMEQILDLKNNLVDERTDNVKFRERIQELENELSKGSNWHHDGMKYWEKDGEGNVVKEKGAFCPTCLDDKGKVVRLLELDNGFYSCHVCEKTYGKWKDVGGGGARRIQRRTYHE